MPTTLGRFFNSITRTQGPDPIPPPEPASLTLSAFGLAELLARRQLASACGASR